MTTKIKICGITSVADATLAVEAGADYLGLIFAEASPRCVSVEQARKIIEGCPVSGEVKRVGVFQNQPAELIHQITRDLQLNLVQLHGMESPEFCSSIPLPVIKVFTTDSAPQMTQWQPYFPVSKYLMIDKPKQKTGSDNYYDNTLDWVAAHHADLPPMFIAGGLNVENVTDVIARTQPFAVDVTSGVEKSPGVKDPDRLKAFCDTVRQNNKRQ